MEALTSAKQVRRPRVCRTWRIEKEQAAERDQIVTANPVCQRGSNLKKEINSCDLVSLVPIHIGTPATPALIIVSTRV
jgi:hypothetical protein